MKKKFYWVLELALISIFTPFNSQAQITSIDKNTISSVIERNFPSFKGRLELHSADKQEGLDVFSQKIKNNKLHVSASSCVAACRGVYDFIRNNGYGISSWTGNRLVLPPILENSITRNVVSPFLHHYYFNVVTFGYSTPYWDWERWEREIDWMALHGIDMPLALVANEAISARVWRKLGLTDEEISNYFSGPAHLPWLRMGNLCKLDGPLPQEWHKDQIALQHKILNRMRALGMKPICPGFAGFVPSEIKRIYPGIELFQTSWAGNFCNWMISPKEELFHTIGKMFIEEWEKEFGKNDYYIVDSFNEMDIPFPSKEDPLRYSMLAEYGDRVYNSIRAGNPEATWVMQGWMFGYQRSIWDYKTLEALVSKVPNDKMLLLDEAVDYNKCFWYKEVNWDFYKGFFGKPWVYGVIPNMGGKSGMTGILDFYANGHLEALVSKNKGNLVGHGMAPEGIENNEVIYEIITDAGWSDKKIDVKEWLINYSKGRYGFYSEKLDTFWNKMLLSVYGTFTDHPRYNWQFRPGITRNGSINLSSDFYSGIEILADVANSFEGNELFEYDFCEWAAAYAAGKAEDLSTRIEDAYLKGDKKTAYELSQKFIYILKEIDAILINHPTKSFQKWIDYARKYGKNNIELADYYEKNARRIITIWGPPICDYSARVWSGLIRDYYVPRWEFYFNQKTTGKSFDFDSWEKDWVENKKGLSYIEKSDNTFLNAIKLVKYAEKNVPYLVRGDSYLDTWSLDGDKSNENTIEWALPPQKIKSTKALRLRQLNEGASVIVVGIELHADGKVYNLKRPNNELKSSAEYPIWPPRNLSGNNECKLRLILKNLSGHKAAGSAELVKFEEE